jgi:hypothetical protein
MTARNGPLGASTDAALIRINQTVPRLRQLAYPEVVRAAEFKCLFERLGDPAPLYLRRRKPLSALGLARRTTDNSKSRASL